MNNMGHLKPKNTDQIFKNHMRELEARVAQMHRENEETLRKHNVWMKERIKEYENKTYIPEKSSTPTFEEIAGSVGRAIINRIKEEKKVLQWVSRVSGIAFLCCLFILLVSAVATNFAALFIFGLISILLLGLNKKVNKSIKVLEARENVSVNSN